MVKTFNTGGTAAALQIFLEGKRMAKEFCACSLCQTFFALAAFSAFLKTWASLIDRDIVVTSLLVV
jgi:hypothetical protein